MPGDSCIICGNSCKKAPHLSYHRFPTNPVKCFQWLRVFKLDPEAVKPHIQVIVLLDISKFPFLIVVAQVDKTGDAKVRNVYKDNYIASY